MHCGKIPTYLLVHEVHVVLPTWSVLFTERYGCGGLPVDGLFDEVPGQHRSLRL